VRLRDQNNGRVYSKMAAFVMRGGAWSASSTSLWRCRLGRRSSIRRLTYELAAAWQGKNAKDSLQMANGGRPEAGDDAFYINRRNECSFGVADGVGGWSDYGVDAGELSRSLCHELEQAHSLSNMEILKVAFGNIKSEGKVKAGGTTICMAHATVGGQLSTLNLGDSGYMIVRDGKIAFVSSPQTHFFNAPYQLSISPPRDDQNVLEDMPSSAYVDTHTLIPEDFVILYTDGYSDNMSTFSTLSAISIVGSIKPKKLTKDGGNVTKTSTLAAFLVTIARRIAVSTTAETPFGLEARRNKYEWSGGKLDDITVVVMSVKED